MARTRRRPRFFYGWVVVAIAFVTMSIAISARTSFSLLYPEMLAEFGWSSALTAGAYSLGFVASITLLPVVGGLMDRFGPRLIVPLGAVLVAAGFIVLRTATDPVGLYVAMGLLIVNGSMAMSYIVHSMFLPKWFERNRGLAVGIAFSGVGVGALIIMPTFQWVIDTRGWRDACIAMAIVVAVGIIPLNLFFQRGAPEDMGLAPDGRDPRSRGVGNAGQRKAKSQSSACISASATGPMLPLGVESKVEQYLKKNCAAPRASSQRNAVSESDTALSTGSVRDLSATMIASASPGCVFSSGTPITWTTRIPCLTSVLARSDAPVKSSAIAPSSRLTAVGPDNGSAWRQADRIWATTSSVTARVPMSPPNSFGRIRLALKPRSTASLISAAASVIAAQPVLSAR